MDKDEINLYVEEYKTEMIEKLAEFVSINTIYDETTVDKKNPFGRGVTRGLEFIYNLAKNDGFEVTNYDNYCVEISYGEGELLDILAHADVVGVSNNWEFDPFASYYDDNYIYGRGTQDDKGPLLATYYALKIIKDHNVKSNKKIRFIIGGNEESGSECLKYYYKTLGKEYPSLGFTPDAEFPLINGEKGITRLEVIYKDIDKKIKGINGGRALNIVMDEVEFKIDDEVKVYKGKAAHASKPNLGINAFIVALEDLRNQYRQLDKIYNDFKDYYGKGLNIEAYDDKLKDLTMNIGKVELLNGDLHIILDIRYPLSITTSKMKEKIEDKGYICNILMDEKPIYMSEDCDLVKKLLESYNEFRADNGSPYTIGGGTYAKSSKNVVAFGMMFEDDIDLMHQDNECIKIEHYLLGSKIYLNALLKLIK